MLWFLSVFGGSQLPCGGGEDMLQKPRTVSAPRADETEPKKNIGGLFPPLIRNGRQEPSSGYYTTSMNYLGESVSPINNFFYVGRLNMSF